MTFDYSELAQTALDLCTEFGREIQLVKLSNGSDIAKPWKGGAQPPTYTDVKTRSAVVVGSNVLYGAKMVSEDLLKRVTHVAYGPSMGETLLDMEGVVDEGVLHRIEWMQELKPGSVPLIVYIGFNK
jgi:hypothetical protein